MGGCWSCAISSTPSSASSIEQLSARLPGCQTSQILLPSHHGFAGTSRWPSETIPLGHSALPLLNFSEQDSCRLQLSGYCTCESHLPLTQRGRPWPGSRSPWHRDPCGAR